MNSVLLSIEHDLECYTQGCNLSRICNHRYMIYKKINDLFVLNNNEYNNYSCIINYINSNPKEIYKIRVAYTSCNMHIENITPILNLLTPTLINLKCLVIYRCTLLQEIPYIPNSVKDIDIDDCHNLTKLPDLPLKLRALYIRDCPNLKQTIRIPETIFFIRIDNIRTNADVNIKIPYFPLLTPNAIAIEESDINPNINNINKMNKYTLLLDDIQPTLDDGWTDAGIFDELPNEILCLILLHSHPSLGHVCKRFRDCIFSAWSVMERTGTNYRDPRLIFRDTALEELYA